MAKALTDYEAAQRHKYRVVSGGEFVPGVTTVIGVTDKPGLKWASSKIAAEAVIENGRRKKGIVAKHRAWLLASKGRTATSELKRRLGEVGTDNEVFAHWARGEFDRQWRAKADRGNRIHDVAQRWAENPSEQATYLVEDAKWIDALEMFHTMYKPRFLHVECIVAYDPNVVNDGLDLPHGGRFDFIAELDGPGFSGVFKGDWKTGSVFPMEVAFQAIGYKRSRLVQYDAAGAMTNSLPLPKLDGDVTVQLREDGKAVVSDPFAIISEDQAWRGFSACRELFEVTKIIESSIKESGMDNE